MNRETNGFRCGCPMAKEWSSTLPDMEDPPEICTGKQLMKVLLKRGFCKVIHGSTLFPAPLTSASSPSTKEGISGSSTWKGRGKRGPCLRPGSMKRGPNFPPTDAGWLTSRTSRADLKFICSPIRFPALRSRCQPMVVRIRCGPRTARNYFTEKGKN